MRCCYSLHCLQSLHRKRSQVHSNLYLSEPPQHHQLQVHALGTGGHFRYCYQQWPVETAVPRRYHGIQRYVTLLPSPEHQSNETIGYVKNVKPDAVPGFDGPTAFAGAINAPDKSFIGSKYFPGPYDASQCTAACQGTTQYDREHPNADGTYDACNFVNSYVLSENNAPQGTYCGLYTKSWGKKYSTNYGQYRGNDYYSISSSYGWTLNPQDPGHI